VTVVSMLDGYLCCGVWTKKWYSIHCQCGL